MTSPAGTYDPKKISLSLNGFTLSGFAEGTFISIKRKTASFESKVGSQGDVVRTRLADKRTDIEFELLQSSMSNVILSALVYADENPGSIAGTGPWPIDVFDAVSGSTYQAAQAWIVKPADAEFADKAGARKWAIECAELNAMVTSGIVVTPADAQASQFIVTDSGIDAALGQYIEGVAAAIP